MTAILGVADDSMGLSAYIREIRKFPMLEANEEYACAKRWREHADQQAAEKLVTSHLRLVVRIGLGFRGYGLPIGEIISEGNIGLMQAVKRFDPDKGCRLSTYAMWWIRASIQEYILRSWSLVKIGTTAAQKRLFFNLRRVKRRLQVFDDVRFAPDQLKTIAQHLNVSEAEVVSMNERLAGDTSLNTPVRVDPDSGELQDWLVDKARSQEVELAESQEYDQRKRHLTSALALLNERERCIFESRRIADPPVTLDQLSIKFGISRERVRQIEIRAYEKVQRAALNAAQVETRAQEIALTEKRFAKTGMPQCCRR